MGLFLEFLNSYVFNMVGCLFFVLIDFKERKIEEERVRKINYERE